MMEKEKTQVARKRKPKMEAAIEELVNEQ
jgi:hypothetical protein